MQEVSMRRIPVVMIVIAFLVSPAGAATDPVAKCTAAKVKAAGKKYASKTKCQAVAIVKGVAVDADCLLKAESKFNEAIVKAESSVPCVGDGTAIENSVDSCLTDLLDEVTATVGDACTDNSDCGALTCATGPSFPGGYCTVEGCPTAGSVAGCPDTESICNDPPFGSNYCADRCDSSEIGTQGSCRIDYQCADVDPGAMTSGGCIVP
jgi:hypothetical protein